MRGYEAARAADTRAYAAFFHALLDRGVYFAPSSFEAIFPSLAHTRTDVEKTIEAVAGAAAAVEPVADRGVG